MLCVEPITNLHRGVFTCIAQPLLQNDANSSPSKSLSSLHHDACNPQLVRGFLALFAMCSFEQLLFSDEVKPDSIHATGGCTCLPLAQTGVH